MTEESFAIAANIELETAAAATTTGAASPPEGRDLALAIAEIISDTPAADTRVLDVQGSSPFTDFFVICSGENERQLRAITRTLTEDLAKVGIRASRSEGSPLSGWMILDFGDVIVHVFSAEQRGYYRIEELWADAQTVIAIQ